jgi:cyclopropane-fatty-acyl-phospholipid synthase
VLAQMLQIFGRPEWRTVTGRSRSYVSRAEASLTDEGVHVHKSCGVATAFKSGLCWGLVDSAGVLHGPFEKLLFCTPPPVTRGILGDAIDDALAADLEAVEYGDNEIYVHSDPSLMPPSRSTWAAWNCLADPSLLSFAPSSSRSRGSMEGAESGFGAAAPATTFPRMNACFVT